MKRLFCFVFLSFLMLALPIMATAEKSGTCGSNVKWVLDDKGTLTISGSGDMERSPSIKKTDCKKIVIKNGITSICSSAFKDFQLVTSISIPSSVKIIGKNAFEKCRKLQNISIPNGVTSIGSFTFSECSSLDTVNIPDSVRKIGYYAFSKCKMLKSIHIPKGVNAIESGVFSDCKSLKEIHLPSSITSIGSCAFWDCDSIKSIIIPSSVSSIGEYAFFWCDGIRKITIPNGTKIIEKLAFASCENLESISLPESIELIGEDAFKGPDGRVKVKLFVSKNSYSHQYAKENSIRFSLQKVKISDCKIIIKNQTFTGKPIKPQMTIEYNGKQLKSGTDYTVIIKNNTNIGNAKVTIKGKGEYSGTTDITFKILPKSTSILKLIPGDKKVTVQWKSQSNKTTGYQIQYSESKDFSNSKTITVNGAKNTKKTISGFRVGDQLYFRIRTFFKTGKTNFYSAWSKAESITIKSIYDYAFRRSNKEYSIYYIFDMDSHIARNFVTNDRGVLVGKTKGNLASGIRITFTKEWSEEFIAISSTDFSRANLIDIDGFNFEFEQVPVSEAEMVLGQGDYYDMDME